MGGPQPAGVAAVIPLYNKSGTVERALESVLAQVEPPAEILVVDDGSSDDGPEKVAGFNDPRLRMVRQANAGPGAARNRGIAETRSPFVAFLDADDVWRPHFLQEIAGLIRAFPQAGLFALETEFGRRDGRRRRPRLYGLPPPPWAGLIDFFRVAGNGPPPFYGSTVCTPRRVLTEVGPFISSPLNEDMDMWGRIALRWPVAFRRESGGIYFLDAENRASQLRGLDRVWPFLATARQAMADPRMAPELRRSLTGYLQKMQALDAVRCLVWGDRRLLPELLTGASFRRFLSPPVLRRAGHLLKQRADCRWRTAGLARGGRSGFRSGALRPGR